MPKGLAPRRRHRLRPGNAGRFFLAACRFFLTACLALLLWTPGGAPALGHVTNTSISRVRVEGARVVYTLRVNAVDLALATGLIQDAKTQPAPALFTGGSAAVRDYLSQRLIIYENGQACKMETFALALKFLPRQVEARLGFQCPSTVRRLLIQYLPFFELDAHHVSIGRLVAGKREVDFILDQTQPEFEIDLEKGRAAVQDWKAQAGRFFLLGIEHILVGFDHILFLIGLIVASLRFRYLVTVVSMFTLAHTLTLLLAALDYVNLPDKLVESLIAVSIAYVAAENLLGRGLRFRWIVTFAFGLVHGLGFAAVLKGLTEGGETHVASLFTFNLGVEAGQLAIVGVLVPLLLVPARFGKSLLVMRAVSIAILLIALYWFGQRAF